MNLRLAPNHDIEKYNTPATKKKMYNINKNNCFYTSFTDTCDIIITLQIFTMLYMSVSDTRI